MNLKKGNLIWWVILIIIVVAIGAYYFLPKDFFSKNNQANDYFTLTVMKEDLSEDEIKGYQDKFDLAVAEIQANADYVNPWFEIATLKKYVGDYRGAEVALLKAGEVRPNNSTSYTNLADLYANFLKEYDKAESAYQTAIRNSLGEWGNDRLYREYAYFAENYLNDFDKSEQILIEGIQNNNQSFDLFVYAADFYKRQGDKDNALKYYYEALKLDPANEAIDKEIADLQNAR